MIIVIAKSDDSKLNINISFFLYLFINLEIINFNKKFKKNAYVFLSL